MNIVKEKANILLEAIAYADSNSSGQSNLEQLKVARKLTERIVKGDLDAKHDLKGLFIAKEDNSGPDTDISLMDVVANSQSLPLQNFIDDLVQAVEEAQGYPAQ